jgi:conjugative transfer signal peptidase TraF
MNRGPSANLARIRYPAAIAIGFVLMFHILGLLGLRLNTSPSLPLGLYMVSKAGTLVEFCPSEPFASIAIARGYRQTGVCADGGTPLLKPVVATSGDLVSVTPNGLEVNHVRLVNTAPLTVDTKNRRLIHWPFGHYTVGVGTFWVASSYNRRSFDSRYFGPIPAAAVRNRLRPILCF